MRDTTNRILNASLEVFKEFGYQKTTTKAIASKAEVAEVTVYRKFSTKKALFEATLRKYLNLSMEDTPIDPFTDSDEFIPRLMENRLERMSRQIAFIRLLIRESLTDTIPQDLHFDKYVETRLKTIVRTHLIHVNQKNHVEAISRMIVGTLLSYVLIPSEVPFHTLDETEKASIVKTYSHLIVSAIKSLK